MSLTDCRSAERSSETAVGSDLGVLLVGVDGPLGAPLVLALKRAGARVTVHRSAVQPDRAGARSDRELSDASACRTLIDQSTATLRRLNAVLFCVAGDPSVRTSLRQLFFVSQAAHTKMREQGGGKIVHVAHLSGGAPVAGLTQLTRTMAVEWAKDNVQVNCLVVGAVEGSVEVPGGRIPARRAGGVGEVIDALLPLALPGQSYLTGQTIAVDGGALAGGSWQQDEG